MPFTMVQRTVNNGERNTVRGYRLPAQFLHLQSSDAPSVCGLSFQESVSTELINIERYRAEIVPYIEGLWNDDEIPVTPNSHHIFAFLKHFWRTLTIKDVAVKIRPQLESVFSLYVTLAKANPYSSIKLTLTFNSNIASGVTVSFVLA